MMETIRTAANSIIVKIIFGIIILAFIFTGVSGFFGMGSSSNNSLYVAKVDGEGISRTFFERQVQAAMSNFQSLANENSELEALIRKNVFNQMLSDSLLESLSKKLNLNISNELVKENIRSQSVFWLDGKFNNQRYLDLLKQNNYTPDNYAEMVRINLRKTQLIDGLLKSDFLLPAEQEITTLYEQQRSIRTAVVPKEIVKVPEDLFTKETLKQYYQQNQAAFNVPEEQFKLSTIAIPYALIEEKTNVSNERVKSYYQKNKSHYMESAHYLYSAIIFENVEEANQAYQALKTGTDFASIAKEQSINNAQGSEDGKLGWFKEQNVPAELKKANLSQKGHYSEPVLLDDGSYIIVKLDDIRKATSVPLDVVFEKVKSDLLQTLTATKFEEEQKYLSSLVVKGLSLQAIEKEAQKRLGSTVKITQSGWQNSSQSILSYPVIQEAIDHLQMVNSDGQASDKIAGALLAQEDNTLYIFKLSDHRDAGMQPFEKVENDIKTAMTNQYINENYSQIVAQIVKEFNDKGHDETYHITLANQQTIQRHNADVDNNIINTAFSLVPNADGKAVYGVASTQNGDVIVAVTGVNTPTVASQDISQQLINEKLNNVGYFLVQNLRSTSNIEMMPNAGL